MKADPAKAAPLMRSVRSRHMKLTRILVFLGGAISTVGCFLMLSAAALPYQDPTPELIATRQEQIGFWQIGFLTSVGVAAAGFFGLLRFRRSQAKDSEDPINSGAA